MHFFSFLNQLKMLLSVLPSWLLEQAADARPLESNPEWPGRGDPNHTQVQPSSKGQASDQQQAGRDQE